MKAKNLKNSVESAGMKKVRITIKNFIKIYSTFNTVAAISHKFYPSKWITSQFFKIKNNSYNVKSVIWHVYVTKRNNNGSSHLSENSASKWVTSQASKIKTNGYMRDKTHIYHYLRAPHTKNK